jgi:hypothetical protein
MVHLTIPSSRSMGLAFCRISCVKQHDRISLDSSILPLSVRT